MRALYSPTAVPGESWIQYSESALVNSLCHFLTASYLPGSPSQQKLVGEGGDSPFLDYTSFQVVHDAAIVIVPPYLGELTVQVSENGISCARRWRVQRIRLAGCVRWYADTSK